MNDDMLNEFYNEAIELIDEAETAIISLEKEEDFSQNFNLLFRCFHSLKGAAGMFDLEDLQSHMHYLENLIEEKKPSGKFSKELLDYLLLGIDEARTYFDTKSITFDYYDPDLKEKGCQNSSDDIAAKTNLEKNDNSSEKGAKRPISKNSKVEENNVVELKTEINKRQENLINSKDSKGLIYILDDEPEILEQIEFIVENAGYEAKTFENSSSLFLEIENKIPDTILTDMNLGKESGIDVMREMHKKIPHLPFIVISGFVTKEVCIEVLNYGVMGIIEKPFDKNQVISMLNHSVEKYKAFKLLNKSIDLIIYQFPEFDKYLVEKGNDSFRELYRSELKTILEKKKQLMSG